MGIKNVDERCRSAYERPALWAALSEAWSGLRAPGIDRGLKYRFSNEVHELLTMGAIRELEREKARALSTGAWLSGAAGLAMLAAGAQSDALEFTSTGTSLAYAAGGLWLMRLRPAAKAARLTDKIQLATRRIGWLLEDADCGQTILPLRDALGEKDLWR